MTDLALWTGKWAARRRGTRCARERAWRLDGATVSLMCVWVPLPLSVADLRGFHWPWRTAHQTAAEAEYTVSVTTP